MVCLVSLVGLVGVDGLVGLLGLICLVGLICLDHPQPRPGRSSPEARAQSAR